MNDYSNLLIIIQPGLRSIDTKEALSVLSDADSKLPREIVEVDMQKYDIEGGVWDDSESYILEKAREIHKLADAKEAVKVLYLGIAEIPHIITLGAYLSDSRYVKTFNYDRDNDSWDWDKEDKALKLKTLGLPKEIVTQSGVAIIRVEISAAIDDDGVESVTGKDRLADIRIQLDGLVPSVASVVRSDRHVQEIRLQFREALASLILNRPNLSLIHLFVAAPAPVCFVIGQELQLRNNVTVQTYRYRTATGQRKAIHLTAEEARSSTLQLTEDEIESVRKVREEIFPRVLDQVQQYADNKKERAKEANWFDQLSYHEILKEVRPFPPLPAIWEVVNQKDRIDRVPRPGNEYTNLRNEWKFSDSMLIGLWKACKDENEVEELIRLFLFHEYIHHHHSLTKFSVEGIGRFENCLERLDYMADLYAIMHQLDYTKLNNRRQVTDREIDFLTGQLDLLLRSTWAFIPGAKVTRFQVRSVRRLLNWYWRHIQVNRCDSLSIALKVLSQAPTIELIGPQVTVGSGRIFMSMEEIDKSVELSLGIVLENAKFFRREDAVNANMGKLMEAFLYRDHESVKLFFEGIFEAAHQLGGALPR
ncbi:SAVED domain-containing protein [Dyadobacter sp. 22481]|uniref:SAVED domain-containing protein n=1 Tax=Dyadobacter sp. 22481 TaxID=3453926 RepID=UPI003F87EA96